MKKLTITLFALLLVVSGCSNANTNITTSDETLITVNGEDITKGDVYKGLKASGNINIVTAALDKVVADTAVKTTKEIEKEAKASLKAYKDSVAADKWEATLKEKGFKNEKDYYENVSLVTTKLAKVTNAYIAKEFDTLAKEYEVKKLRIFVTNDADKASAAAKAMKKKDADYEAIAAKYGVTTTYSAKEGIYTNKSGLPSQVWNEIKTTSNQGITKIVEDKATTSYYIVKVVDSNAAKFKDEAITAIKGVASTNADGLKLEDVAYHYFLLEAGYNIHDTDVYSALLTSSQKFKRD